MPNALGRSWPNADAIIQGRLAVHLTRQFWRPFFIRLKYIGFG